jgi:hypothetical protein
MKPTPFHSAVPTLKAHPVELFLGLLYFAFAVVALNADRPAVTMWGTVIAYFPLVFAAAYSFNYLFTEKPRSEYYVTLLFVAPLFVFHKQFASLFDSVAFPVTMLLALLVMLVFRRAKDNAVFVRQNLQMGVDFALAGLVSALLMGALSAIYASVVYIFDWAGWADFYVYALAFVVFVVYPFAFCHLQDRSLRREPEALPRVAQTMLNYVFSPATVVYTLILYIYLLTIALRWELPKGGVALLVTGFLLAGFAGHMAQQLVTRRPFDWFYRHFTFIALPPLVLFWVGAMHRVLQYGLTEPRVYLLLFGLLLTLFVVFLRFRRLQSYRLMLTITALSLVLFTYVPGLTARDLEAYSQEARADNALPAAPADGLSAPPAAASDTTTAPFDTIINRSDSPVEP